MKKLSMFLLLAIAFVINAENKKVQDYGNVEVRDSVEKSIPKVDNVTVINKEDIESLRGSRTADALLTDIAGIDVARTSAGGNKSKGVMLRGFDESRMLVVLNGRQLNGAGVMGGDYVDWSSIPVDQIEKIEVIRGAKSAQYGNAPGGVIKITTTKDVSEKQTSARFTYGVTPDIREHKILDQSFDLGFSHSGSISKWFDYTLNIGHFETDGYLRNNYTDNTSIGGNFTFNLPLDFYLTGNIIYTWNKRGFAISNKSENSNYDPSYPMSGESAGGGPGIKWGGGDFYFGDRSYWDNERNQYDVTLIKKFDNAQITGRLYLNDQDRTEYYYDINDTNHLVLERYTKPEDMTGGWQVFSEINIPFQKITAGLEGFRLRYTGADILEADTSFFWMIKKGVKVNTTPTDNITTTKAINQFAIYAQDDITLADSAVEVHAGFRYDRFIGHGKEEEFIGTSGSTLTEEVKRNGFNPNLGTAFHLWKGGTLGVDLALAYRFPNAPEFYWFYNGYQPTEFDKGSLEPERALQFEGIVKQRLLDGALDLNVRGYAYRVKDYIRWIFGYKPSRVIYNIDQVDFFGLEIEAAYNFPKLVSLSANYTYQTTNKKGDKLDYSTEKTDDLPELPKHKFNGTVKFRTQKGAGADLKVRFVGEKEVVWGNPSNMTGFSLETIDPFTTVDLTGIVPVLKKDFLQVNFRGGIENLFNVEYEEEYGFPMPGITFLAGIDTKF